MKLQTFEVVYTATAKCVVLVSAFTAADAETLVRTAEAGDVADDVVEYERQVVSVTTTAAPFFTNSDPGDESHLPGR